MKPPRLSELTLGDLNYRLETAIGYHLAAGITDHEHGPLGATIRAIRAEVDRRMGAPEAA